VATVVFVLDGTTSNLGRFEFDRRLYEAALQQIARARQA
jgi:hypothetical protein